MNLRDIIVGLSSIESNLVCLNTHQLMFRITKRKFEFKIDECGWLTFFICPAVFLA